MNLLNLAKVPAFALVIAAEYIARRPPNPAPKNADQNKFQNPTLASVTSSLYPLWRTIMIIPVSTSAKSPQSSPLEFPSPLSSRVLATLFTNPANAHNVAPLSAPFLAGFLLVTLGAAWRKRCYDALGHFFTFQLALHKEHKLVTTGPYAVVRHPSYTAFLTTYLGCLMTLTLPGSYVYESGMLQIPWVAAGVTLWGLSLVSLIVVVVARARVEDAVLREEFGAEWDVWARKTPYALVPYVY